MSATVLRWADRRTEPWANGAGVTHPLTTGGAAGDWRVSVAEIAAGAPFSHFPGVHRQFVCLGPAPLVLYVEGQARSVPVGGITTFSGDSDVRCEVSHPSYALNVMSRNGVRAPQVRVVIDVEGETLSGPAGRTVLVVMSGSVQVTTPEAAVTLGRLDAVDWSDPAVGLDGVGSAVLVS